MLLLINLEVALAKSVRGNSARKDIGERVGEFWDLAREFRAPVVSLGLELGS